MFKSELLGWAQVTINDNFVAENLAVITGVQSLQCHWLFDYTDCMKGRHLRTDRRTQPFIIQNIARPLWWQISKYLSLYRNVNPRDRSSVKSQLSELDVRSFSNSKKLKLEKKNRSYQEKYMYFSCFIYPIDIIPNK